METPYSLSDRPSRWGDIQLMRSMRETNASHVRVGPGKYIDVTKKNLPQSFFLLFGQEGANISVFIRPIVPCPPNLPGHRAMIAILEAGSRRPDCWSFHLSHALVPTTDNTGELLIGCSEG